MVVGLQSWDSESGGYTPILRIIEILRVTV